MRMERKEELLFQCPVCLDSNGIPVKLKCFSCAEVEFEKYPPQQNEEKEDDLSFHPPCSSFLRLCFFCAVQYLELHKNITERSSQKKCLFCPQYSLPPLLTFENALDIDFGLLKILSDLQDHQDHQDRQDRQDHHQPPPTLLSCQFCHEYSTNDRLKMLAHIQKYCMEFKFPCPCTELIARKDWVHHIQECGLYSFCTQCEKWVDQMTFSKHMKELHCQCLCSYCHLYVPLSDFVAHLIISCPSRFDVCPLCQQPFRRCDMISHIRSSHLFI